MDVDEAGRDEAPRRVDLARAAPGDATHPGDAIAVDRYVGCEAGPPGPVDDLAVPDHEVVCHGNGSYR